MTDHLAAKQHDAEKQQEMQRENEERRAMMLSTFLTPAAKERLDRIALVKPEKAVAVSQMINSMAQRGALTEKISDERIKSMLNSVTGNERAPTKVTIQRKRYGDEDDDEDYDL